MKLFIAIIIAAATAGTALAEDYLPLATGNFWSYISDNGQQEMRVVAGQVPIFQGYPYAIEYPISPANEGLVNYWSSEPDGGVLLWGFFRDGWGYLYQPPIRIVDAPLSVGKTWTNTSDFYTLPDTTFHQTYDLTFTVFEEPELTVPAGVFPCFGIGTPDPTVKSGLRNRYTLWGELKTAKAGGPDGWFSLGVGLAQFSTDMLYQLETYTDHPVTVEVSSWGAVKALYRGAN